MTLVDLNISGKWCLNTSYQARRSVQKEFAAPADACHLKWLLF